MCNQLRIWTLCILVGSFLQPANLNAQFDRTSPNARATAGQRQQQLSKKPTHVRMGVQHDRGQIVLPSIGSNRRATAGSPVGIQWADKADRLDPQSAWYVSPIGNSLAHIDWYMNGNAYALGAVGLQQPLQIGLYQQYQQSLNHLWRFQPFPGYPNHYLLESLQYPGYCATFAQNSIYLEPIAFLPTQQWWFDRPAQILPTPVVRSNSQQVIANEPLPPAQIDLVNTTRQTAVVVIADLRDPRAAEEIQIPAGSSKRFSFDRDAGSTIVESFEYYSSNGNWDQQQRTYQIPAVPLYDISVFEIFLQSIAIDRTGTSPNPIEDVNYQPKSVGFFQVPPGDLLPAQGQMDVMRLAQQARNPGGVRPLPSKLEKPAGNDSSNPLQEILDEIQSRRGSF